MKENSIEEDIKILKELGQKYYKNGEIKIKALSGAKYIWALQNLLSDYKKVLKINEVLLKENEELKEDRKNNNVMISLAQNEALNYMSGYEDGKKHKMTAMVQVVENQKYYIFRKQMEKYEEFIKRLKKENEELNLKYYMLYTGKIENLKAQEFKIKSQVIPVQKVKDIIDRIDYDIKKTKEIISKNTNIYASYRKNDYQIVRLRAMNTKSLDIKKRLQKLLESEE